MAKSKVAFNSITLGDIKFKDHKAGYDALEVDKTLDVIIRDYEWFENFYAEAKTYIAKLEGDIKSANDKIRKLEIEVSKHKDTLETIKKNKNVNEDNLNLYLRIDRLEKALWHKGVDPSKVK